MHKRTSSVLTTQEPVLELQAKIAQAKARLAEMEKQLEPLIAAHREQIRRSLSSRNATERKMAASIATWWEVPLPTR